SLVLSAILAREVGRRRPDTDYRALGASSFLGLGSVWAQGLSGSAALQMATPGALQPAIRDIVARGGRVPGGLISLGHTIFLWQSLLAVAVEIVVVAVTVWLYTPPAGVTPVAAPPSEPPEPPSEAPAARQRNPGEWLEHSPLLTLAVVALGSSYLAL